MFITILGVIVLIAGTVLKRSPESGNRFGGIITTVGIVIIVLGVLFSAIKVIEPGKVGVQTLFGKVQDDVLESGMHVINPLFDITNFDTRTQNYTMSAVHTEGQQQ